MRIADDETVLDHRGVETPARVSGEVHTERSVARLLVLVVATLLVAGTGVVALVGAVRSSDDASSTDGGPAIDGAVTVDDVGERVAADPAAAPGERADAVARALESQSVAGLTFAYERPSDVAAELGRITAGLGEHTLVASVGNLVPDGEYRLFAPVQLDWTLADGTGFVTDGELRLVRVGSDWQVDWDPALLHAGLTPGDVFVRERVTSPRAPILGADGFELVGERPVTEIGVVAGQVPSIDELSGQLAELLGVDSSGLADRLRRSPSGDVTAVAVRRIGDMESLAAPLSELPGVVLTESTAILPPYDSYGRALLGWNGEVTAEILEQSPDHFAVGDLVGRSGLQATFNERLAGLPGSRIRIDRRFPLRDGAGKEIPADADTNIVHLSAPRPPQAVQTTIDHRYQDAAERALRATDLPSSLVAVRVSTGEVLAVANGPGAAAENHALTGRYPPGSIFKVVTAYVALEQGATADQPIGCPASLVVDGKEFRNAEALDRGTIPLRDAFAYSCNTSFVQLGEAFDVATLSDAARRFGIGADYELGTAAYAGSVPVPNTKVDQAAASFGQGRILVSPLSMAVMAATAAGGAYRPPTLVVGVGAVAEPDRQLDPVAIASLQDMMGAVVDYGTGQALRGIAGGQVHGKTGSAEFGSGDPPPTHAWFVGYQGDVAFAVVVDGGGFGGSVAAPLAAEFARNVAEQG